jgi:hypothetical protein
MKNILNWLACLFLYLFFTIFYQKFFGVEPYNNSFSMGLPRFYYEFYSNDCTKLNGSNFINLLINIIIVTTIFLIYLQTKRKR